MVYSVFLFQVKRAMKSFRSKAGIRWRRSRYGDDPTALSLLIESLYWVEDTIADLNLSRTRSSPPGLQHQNKTRRLHMHPSTTWFTSIYDLGQRGFESLMCFPKLPLAMPQILSFSVCFYIRTRPDG